MADGGVAYDICRDGRVAYFRGDAEFGSQMRCRREPLSDVLDVQPQQLFEGVLFPKGSYTTVSFTARGVAKVGEPTWFGLLLCLPL